MDGHVFDRLTRLLAGQLTRRSGLAGALGALAAGMPAGDLAARQRARQRTRQHDERSAGDAEVIDEKKPCGPKARDNRCKKHKDCCTKYCKPPKGKGRTGRCRCIKPGKKCKTGQTCCGGATCANKTCTKSVVPTCNATGSACSSDAAQGGAAACCSGLICESGSCSACVPNVCASCTYTTIQAAIDDLEGGTPNTAYIAAGTYVEDLTITNDMRLVGCGEVVVKNLTAGRRTVKLPTSAPATPADAVVIELKNIHVTTDTVAPNFGGGIGGGLDGNGDTEDGFANLTLSGSSKITGCRTHDRGGGISVDTYSTLTLKDDAELSGNFSDTYGGAGIYTNNAALYLKDFAAVRNNTTNNDGGGINSYYSVIEMSGSSTVAGNQAGEEGGGISIYADSYAIPDAFGGMPILAMKDQSSITANYALTALTSDVTNAYTGGGGVEMTGACDDTNFTTPPFTGQTCLSIELSGFATISGNFAGKSGAGGYGGGIEAGYTDLILNDNASITGNFAYASLSGASGSQAWLSWDKSESRPPTVVTNGSSTIGEQCRLVDIDLGTNVVTNCPA